PTSSASLGLSGARRSVVDGDSPKSAQYATEKRPSSQKPQLVAISVTVILCGSPRSSARRAKCIRRSNRYRFGLIPRCSLQQARGVECDTPIAALRHIKRLSEVYGQCLFEAPHHSRVMAIGAPLMGEIIARVA